MRNYDETIPEEFLATAERLRELRPEPSESALERAKLRASVRHRGLGGRQGGPLMRSRAVLTAALVIGLIMTGGSAGLAISGVSGSGSAGVAGYLREAPPAGTDDVGAELRELQSGGGGEAPSPSGADRGPTDDVQAARQLEDGDRDTLPFTGLAAIPLMLIGVGLTLTAVVLRRRLSEPPSA